MSVLNRGRAHMNHFAYRSEAGHATAAEQISIVRANNNITVFHKVKIT